MIFLAFGPRGTTKTTWALDEEIPSDYYELELGGYRRARARIEAHKRDVRVHPFRVPLTNLEEEGQIASGGKAGVGAGGTYYELKGWREVWHQFLQEYMKNLKSDGNAKQVIDTGTKMWLIIRQAFQQQLQEATGKQEVAMDQLKYTDPNARMEQVMAAPEHFGKDLILICHEDTVWGTSQVKADGFRGMEDAADVSLRFRIEDKKPVANIWKMGGASTGIVGMDIYQPTMAKVRQVLAAAEVLQINEVELPGTADEVIEMGSVFL